MVFIFQRIISFIVSVLVLISVVSVPVSAKKDISSGLKANVAESYNEVLQKIVDEYGISTRSYSNDSRYSKGLLYNELIDYDGNGVDELYLIYNESEDLQNEFVEQIWIFENNRPKKIHEDTYTGWGRNDTKKSAFGKKDGKVYMFFSEDSSGGGLFYYNYKVCELVEGKLVDTLKIGHSVASPLPLSELQRAGMTSENGFTLEATEGGEFISSAKLEIIENGKKRLVNLKAEDDYKDFMEYGYLPNKIYNTLSQYGVSEEKWLIYESGGSLDLGVKPNSDKLILDLRDVIFKSYDLKNTYPEKTDSEKSEIIEYINGFNVYYFSSNFDVSKDYTKALQFLLYDSDDEYKEPSEVDSSWCKISAENIDKQLYETFGLTANHNFKNESLLYKDGYYHYFEGGAGNLPSSTQPNSIYKIDSNIYYIDFTIYGEGTESWHENDVNSNQPKHLWGISDKDCLIDSTGYAVLKKVGNKYQLLRYNREGDSLSPEDLALYKDKVSPESNIKIDYSKLDDYTNPSEYISNLDKLLESMDKLPNDKANSDIVKYIEYSIEHSSDSTIKAQENMVDINSEIVASTSKDANATRNQFDSLLSEYDIKPNKTINLMLKLQSEKVSMKNPVKVKFDSDLADELDNSDGIKVVIDDIQNSIYISSENLKNIIAAHGSFTIELVKDNDIYNIVFLDKENNPIKHLEYPVVFAFSAESEFASVFANYKGGSENWGGQYDGMNKTIEFSTVYPGKYSVLEKEINIDDIDRLSESQQNAIKFMVSKGYFTLDGDSFNPESSLSRYDFTHALVKIFFALDPEAQTTFSDIQNDDEYYPYIASAQKSNIAKGFEDNTFRGTLTATKEEVITFCGRTLADKKGYIYPDDINSYLKFADNNSISDWAKQDIALSVRSAIVNNGGMLEPQSQITRADSAEILYKLFMLLYDVIPSESEQKTVPLLPISIAVASISVGGFGVFMFKRSDKLSLFLSSINASKLAIVVALIIAIGLGMAAIYRYNTSPKSENPPDKTISEQSVALDDTKINPTNITLPDVFGMKESEAVSLMESKGLQVNDIVYEYSYETEGVVIAQSPAAGEIMEGNSGAVLTVSKGPDQTTFASETSSHPTYYRVITGSFRVKSNAENQVEELKASGFDAVILAPFKPTSVKGAEELYCVMSGSFTTMADAERQVENLESAKFDARVSIYDY